MAETIYHIARSLKELEEGFSLVYREYAARGYIPTDYKCAMRISIYNALPSTTTFVATQNGTVVGTVTLVCDSFLGLPMDEIYKDETDVLRKKGCKIAEVSQLSIDSRLFPKSWYSLFHVSKMMFVFSLFKLVFDYARFEDKLNGLCIAINPKQANLYDFICFENIGGLKYYNSVNQAPALAKYVNFDTLEERLKQRPVAYHIFYGGKTDPGAFAGKYKLTPEDMKYLFVEKSDIFQKVSKEKLKYVKSCYPAGALDNIISGL